MSLRILKPDNDELVERTTELPSSANQPNRIESTGRSSMSSSVPSEGGSRTEKPAKKETRWSDDLNHIKFIPPPVQDDLLPQIPRIIETTDIGNTLLPLLRKQSLSRLEEIELKQLEIDKTDRRSIASIEPEQKLTSVLSLKNDLSRLSAALQRQLSEFNLSQHVQSSRASLSPFENVQRPSITNLRSVSASEEELLYDTFCTFPGSLPGENCHTVAAAVLGKGKMEHYPSSSSSSDDLYKSTRYGKEVLQEKLRGQESLTITKEASKLKVQQAVVQKTPVKSQRCSCHRNKKRHANCFTTSARTSEDEKECRAPELSSDQSKSSSKPESRELNGKITIDHKSTCTRKTCLSMKRAKKCRHICKGRSHQCPIRKPNRSRKAKKPKKLKELFCQCHTHGVDVKNSDFNPLRQGKTILSFKKTKSKDTHRCGGFFYENAQCCCNVCSTADKPWHRLARGGKTTLIDIPYRLSKAGLKRREQNVVDLRKTLGDQISTLEDFCNRTTCENAIEQSAKPTINETLDKMKRRCPKVGDNRHSVDFSSPEPPKLGYYLEVNDDRMTRGENFTEVQRMAETVVHCQLQQDLASMKVCHFLSNLPKRQSCFQKPNYSRLDGRTCYDLKLIERLAGVVQFNTTTDRRIHEFSTIPKFVKFQEPQLVCDPATKLPEIKTLLEDAKMPTIYRDLFKNNKRMLRKLMDAVIAPLQWFNETGLWEMKVSLEPDGAEENQTRLKQIDINESVCYAVNKRFCAGRYRLYFEVFAEVIRQELLECPERAILMAKIREEFLMTLLIFDGGLEISLASAYKAADDPSVYEERTSLLDSVQDEIISIQLEIETLKALVWNLEKWSEDQGVVRDYLHDDAEKHWKKTNHQLEAQYEAIQAGLLYDLD